MAAKGKINAESGGGNVGSSLACKARCWKQVAGTSRCNVALDH